MQAAMITHTLGNMEGRYIMLLDITKAFPSVHHTLLLCALRHKGVPHHILDMVQQIYHHGQSIYHHLEGDITFQPKRGVKEGCPMSPHLFMLTDEIMIRELQERVPCTKFFVYMDGIAVVTHQPTHAQNN